MIALGFYALGIGQVVTIYLLLQMRPKTPEIPALQVAAPVQYPSQITVAHDPDLKHPTTIWK